MDLHDPIASLSHLLMAGWALFASAILLRLAAHHTRMQRLGLMIYACSVVLLYLASGLFHGLHHSNLDQRRKWQLLDQSAIFWLILGSNVPIIIYVLPTVWRWIELTLLISIALAGTLGLWLIPAMPHRLLVIIYLSMGILGLLPIRAYYRYLGWSGLKWVGLLTTLYFAGGIFEGLQWPTFMPGWLTYHEMLHFFDMAGTWAHYALLLKIVVATPPSRRVGNLAGDYPKSTFRLTPDHYRTKL